MIVDVTSADCDALVHAMAILAAFREHISPPSTAAAGEEVARVAIGETVLKRIILDAMMQSPVAIAAMRAPRDGQPEQDDPGPAPETEAEAIGDPGFAKGPPR